jgi:hypothetical protein
MAFYYLHTERISRSRGSETPLLAAYRAGEKIRNDRTGRTADYSKRDDVVHKEIVLPRTLAGRPDMTWARDRKTLWCAAEAHNEGRNDPLGRKWEGRLPAELSADERRDLALRLAQEFADRQGCAVDLCIHLPRPTSGRDCHHFHLMTTLHEVTPAGFGALIQLELSSIQRKKLGIEGTNRADLKEWRCRWADLVNDGLALAGFNARVDHRSLQERGIEHEPMPTLPKKVLYSEMRTGKPHPVGERIRAQHAERVEARKKGPEEYAQVVARQKAQAAEERQARRLLAREKENELRPGQLTREEILARKRAEYQAKCELEEKDPEAMAQWRNRINEKNSNWRRKHPEKAQASRRKYEQKHPDRVRASKKKYNQKNAEKIKRKQREKRQIERERKVALKPADPVQLAREQAPAHGPRKERTPRQPSRSRSETDLTAAAQLGMGRKRSKRKTKSRSRSRDHGPDYEM